MWTEETAAMLARLSRAGWSDAEVTALAIRLWEGK